MVRIGHMKNMDKDELVKLAKRCDELHKEMLKKWGNYTYDDLCVLYSISDDVKHPDAKAYLAMAMGMLDENCTIRVK